MFRVINSTIDSLKNLHLVFLALGFPIWMSALCVIVFTIRFYSLVDLGPVEAGETSLVLINLMRFFLVFYLIVYPIELLLHRRISVRPILPFLFALVPLSGITCLFFAITDGGPLFMFLLAYLSVTCAIGSSGAIMAVSNDEKSTTLMSTGSVNGGGAEKRASTESVSKNER